MTTGPAERSASCKRKTQGSGRDVKRVGAVGNDHTPAPVCEGVGAGLGNDVPVLGPNVVAEHVADFHGIEASDACQFRDGVQHFFGLKLCFHGTGGVVHLGGDGAAGVDESNPWQVGPCLRGVELGEGLSVSGGRSSQVWTSSMG